MILQIKSLALKDFKGIRNASFNFKKFKSIISGENGTGKTTLATAWLWLIAGRDIELTANPEVFPIDATEEGEYTPSVEAELVVDGKPLKIKKYQKRRFSKPDDSGKRKVTYTNFYEINDCEKSERDFIEGLAERAIEADKMLLLSHVDSFLNMKPDEKRKILFNLIANMTDTEIVCAALSRGLSVETVAEQAKNYKIDEIEAMAKASIRKVREAYGKDGEILRAKIEGLLASRSNITEKREDILSELDKAQKAIAKVHEEEHERILQHHKDIEEARAEIDNANKVVSEINNRLMATQYEESVALENELRGKIESAKQVSEQIATLTRESDQDAYAVANFKRDNESIKEAIKALENGKNEATVCRFCGQTLPPDKLRQVAEGIKAEIKQKKDTYKANEEAIKVHEAGVKEKTETIQNLTAVLDGLNAGIEDAKAKIQQSRTERPISAEYEQAVAERQKAQDRYGSLVAMGLPKSTTDVSAKEAIIADCNRKLALMDKDDEIGAQVGDCRKMQAQYEQTKADAEKILDELSVLKTFKNDLLTESINALFDSCVKWKFYDYQKNGEVKDVCDLYIEGKKAGESANTGLYLKGKIHVVEGLQKVYEQIVPLFVDGYECLSDSTEIVITSGMQIIALKVTNDSELKIEGV